MPEYVLVVVLTHLLERPLPSQGQAQARPVGSMRLHHIKKLPLPSSCLRRRTKGQAVRSDLSFCLGSFEQVAPTELARAGAIYYKQVAPLGLNDVWVKTRSPKGTKGDQRGPKGTKGDQRGPKAQLRTY